MMLSNLQRLYIRVLLCGFMCKDSSRWALQAVVEHSRSKWFELTFPKTFQNNKVKASTVYNERKLSKPISKYQAIILSCFGIRLIMVAAEITLQPSGVSQRVERSF